MNSKSKRVTAVSAAIVVVLLVATLSSQNGDDFFGVSGIWSILPPLIAISLAFVTQNVVISLLVGVLSGTFLISLSGGNFFDALINSFLMAIQTMLDVLADPWNAGIVLQVLAIGGLVALITKMGGAMAIAKALAKRANGPVSAQIITWLMGLIIFFDDYANALIIGPIMRPVCDKNKISREKLSFIIDATAAPVAGIALISTWIGAEISYIKNGFDLAGITDVSAYNLFVSTIPYRFYNLLMLAMVVIIAITLREYGPMLSAERKARKGIIIGAEQKSSSDQSFEMMDTQTTGKLSIWNAIVPLGTLIVASFLGFYFNGRSAIIAEADPSMLALLDNPLAFKTIQECFGYSDASIVLFQAAIFAGIVALIMGCIQKKFTVDDGINQWVSGVKAMTITGVILILAWSLSSTISELGTASFLVSTLSGSVQMWILPSIIFILGAIISFATGTSYGTMGILMPLAIPFAHAVSPNDYSYLVVVSSAVLTGAIFGDHSSPISDTTILSAMGADCDLISHVSTQLPYALTVAIIAVVFGYIPVGFGLPIWAALPIAVAAVFGTVIVMGKRVPPESE